MKNKIKVAISWSGIPVYAARLLHEAVKKSNFPIVILGVNPQMPIEETESIIGQKVYWVGKKSVTSWSDLSLPVPDIFFQAGWFIPSFNNVGREVKQNGGKVVCLIDNRWKNNLRQWIGAIKFRLFYRNRFFAVWVPGKSGTKLLRFFGMLSSKIYQGLYASDSECFQPGAPLHKRPKQFIFVGRLSYLKGIPALAKAFRIFNKDYPDWKLVTYGIGNCKRMLDDCSQIEIRSFASSIEVAEALKESRFFVLPTLTDNWPLVVSEAALAGCGLILSNKVGNIPEFLNNKNGFIFPAKSVKGLVKSLRDAALLPDWRLKEVYNESIRLGSCFGTSLWFERFQKIISDLREN